MANVSAIKNGTAAFLFSNFLITCVCVCGGKMCIWMKHIACVAFVEGLSRLHLLVYLSVCVTIIITFGRWTLFNLLLLCFFFSFFKFVWRNTIPQRLKIDANLSWFESIVALVIFVVFHWSFFDFIFSCHESSVKRTTNPSYFKEFFDLIKTHGYAHLTNGSLSKILHHCFYTFVVCHCSFFLFALQ